MDIYTKKNEKIARDIRATVKKLSVLLADAYNAGLRVSVSLRRNYNGELILNPDDRYSFMDEAEDSVAISKTVDY